MRTLPKNINLKKHNTFGIDVNARMYYSITLPEHLYDIYQEGLFEQDKFLILGGGSNVLFTKDYDGLVISNQINGISIYTGAEDYVLVNAGAGVNWDLFVKTAIRNKYYGLENLGLIPGNVGSAPVQNIGAYGVEQKDCFHSLLGFDLETGEFRELSAEECKFGYRNSIFKNELKNKFIITNVKYKLKREFIPNLSYSEIRTEINKFMIRLPDARYIYDTICRFRNKKLPDPKKLGNAGSFFKNPVIENDHYLELKEKYNSIVSFPVENEKVKLSAARLIELCGFKGKRIGDAGVYEKHALILVNYGNASGQEIYDLSEEIRLSVLDKFGLNLEREVQVIE